jgi:hypothetical protein
MADDEIDEMIRTAIYLHLDDERLVPALEWLDERVAAYDARKNDLTLIRQTSPMIARQTDCRGACSNDHGPIDGAW